jgi:hypothetical protein
MVEAKKPPSRRTNPPLPASVSKESRLLLDATRIDDEEPVTRAPETMRIAPPSERWESDSDLARTARLPGAPRQSTNAPPRPPPASNIEMLVVDERQPAGGERRPWRAAEVWTKRRVYGLDSTFRCVEILDRETGRPELTHEMLGARLGGGRHRDADTVRFSYPLPLPGMEAMFSKGKKHGYTSVVERMVVRIRVLHTSADDASPSWEDIASRWSEVPQKP